MAEIRQANLDDVAAILALQPICYPVLSQFSRWGPQHLARHQEVFPEGQLVVESDGEIVGASAAFITRTQDAFRPHTFREITQAGTFNGHDPLGDVLYGAEIMVLPALRGLGLARRMYEERFKIVARLGLRCFAAGGRIPDYAQTKGTVTVEEYVRQVVEGERVDRVLTPQLRNGLRVAAILPDYLNDPNSANYATLLVWENPEGGDRTIRNSTLSRSSNAIGTSLGVV